MLLETERLDRPATSPCEVEAEHRAPAAAASPVLVGRSVAFADLLSRLPAVSRAQRTTLLGGPTGSGKDVVARALHAQSTRAHHPYVAVHCAALPEPLAEAELFGHCRGAFTGALQSRAGLIRTASQGTLFLDEIDSLSLAVQAKLLRFLETGEFRAVGSDRIDRSAAWVIAASNQDLRRRVREGSFRADLLYRLEVIRVDVPGLAEREGDVLHLAEYFLALAGGGRKQFTEEARIALARHEWPGNVRELKHRVESAALLSDSPLVDATALGLARPAMNAQVHAAVATDDASALEHALWSLIAERRMTLAQAVQLCERALIRAALRVEGNNRTRAAARLGIHVRTIFKKLVA
jgi:DNA-binding NtrC family response regulator